MSRVTARLQGGRVITLRSCVSRSRLTLERVIARVIARDLDDLDRAPLVRLRVWAKISAANPLD